MVFAEAVSSSNDNDANNNSAAESAGTLILVIQMIATLGQLFIALASLILNLVYFVARICCGSRIVSLKALRWMLKGKLNRVTVNYSSPNRRKTEQDNMDLLLTPLLTATTTTTRTTRIFHSENSSSIPREKKTKNHRVTKSEKNQINKIAMDPLL
jgi:hypothetical protein